MKSQTRVNNSKIHIKFDKNEIGSDKLKIPTVAEADKLLNEAEKLNPGRWVAHSSRKTKSGQMGCSQQDGSSLCKGCC